MSNDFPSVPSDLELGGVTYQVEFNSAGNADIVASGSEFYFASAVTAVVDQAETGGNVLAGYTLTFNFDTPGTFGSFEQSTVEANLADVITAQVQQVVNLAGGTLADLQSQVTVERAWSWTDSAGYQLFYSDAMTYPPA